MSNNQRKLKPRGPCDFDDVMMVCNSVLFLTTSPVVIAVPFVGETVLAKNEY